MYVCVQRNFGASRCSVCGMVYTKGHEEDEKLHKAYHQGAVQGFKFQVSGTSRMMQLLLLVFMVVRAADAQVLDAEQQKQQVCLCRHSQQQSVTYQATG